MTSLPCSPPVAALLFATILSLGATSCTTKAPGGYEGYVEGKYVYVASPQAGRLDELAVSRGQQVTQGESLFTLERNPELAAAQQATRLLQADEARLQDLRLGKRPPEIDAVRAQLAQATAEHQKAVDLLKSYEKQFAAGGMSETDLIAARSAVDSSDAMIRQYKANITVAELPARDDQIKAQQSVIEADRAALQQAEWRLQQKSIPAPRSGLVFDTLFRQGEFVAGGNPVVQILPPENIEVRFFVPETLVGTLKLGQTVSVRCDGCAAPVAAAITFISDQIEYTPPVIYSNENRAKLVFMVIAKPSVDHASLLHPGQPLEVRLQ